MTRDEYAAEAIRLAEVTTQASPAKAQVYATLALAKSVMDGAKLIKDALSKVRSSITYR